MVISGNYRNRAESRKKPRRHCHYSASIFTGGKGPARTCTISDIPQFGARLVLDNADELPDRFMLLLTRDGGARRRCRVIWRNGTILGVEFAGNQS